MSKFSKLFSKSLSIIGMIHVKALPGTPLSKHSVNELVEMACKEALIYKEHNVDGVLIENMFDIPYITSKDPETIATMTRICSDVKRVLPSIPCGVQILAGLNKEAIAVANAAGLQFIRAEGFVFAHVADEGFMDACAGPLLRYRRLIEADDILIFTDIKKKHASHFITNDINIEETAKASKFFLTDGVIITGSSTGKPAALEDIRQVKRVKGLPIIVGSGITFDNIQEYAKAGVDAVIIGSDFKKNGFWENELDEERIKRLIQKMAFNKD